MEGVSLKPRLSHIQTPWSACGGEFPSRERYPALRHLFQCDQGAGTYSLRDRIGGVGYFAQEFTAPSAVSVRSSIENSNKPLDAGSWAQPGAGIMIIFVVWKAPTLAYIGIGRSAVGVQEILLGDGAAYICTVHGGVENGNTVLNAGANSGISRLDPTIPSISGAVLEFGSQITPFWTDADGRFQSGAPEDMTAITAMSNIPPYGSMAPGGTGLAQVDALYMMGVMFPASVPSDLGPAMEWTRAAASLAGTKGIYPGWMGR